LLRSVLSELSSSGNTELSVFTSSSSPGRDVIAGLGKRVEPFLSGLKLERAEEHGFYVDQLYF